MDFTTTVLAGIGRWAVMRAALEWWRRMKSRPIFYPNRAVLARESPLADKINKSATIDAMWLTGAKAIIEIPNIETVQRLLLPAPGSKSLAYFRLAMVEPRDLDGEIRETTRIAKNKGIEVRWLNEFLGYTMTIGDAKGDNAWYQIEIAFPTIHGGDRPSIEFSRSKHAKTIEQASKIFGSSTFQVESSEFLMT